MRRTLIALGLIAVMLAATGCQRRGGGDTAGGGGDAIKVGVYLDLSGQTSSFGLSTRRGIEMARDEINNAGGINGRKIELVVEDEQGEPGKVTTVVTKLLRQDQVKALLGEVASTNSLTAAPKAQEAHIPMITPSSTNPEVTKKGDYIFRMCFIDTYQGPVLARFLVNDLHVKRAALRDAIAATKNFPVVTGVITFDANRNPIGKRVVIDEIRNGQLALKKTIEP